MPLCRLDTLGIRETLSQLAFQFSFPYLIRILNKSINSPSVYSYSFMFPCNVCVGKDYSLEVSEPELELEEMSDAEESEVENVIDGENLPHTPTQGEPEGGGEDTSAMKFPKPMMKVFHGRTAPGLRIRSAPSLSVRSRGFVVIHLPSIAILLVT